MDRMQVTDLITRVLSDLDPRLLSGSALNLMLGTMAVESGFGHYLRQVKGPALGAFQVEGRTFKAVVKMYGDRYPYLKTLKYEQLEYDLKASIVVARLLYWSIKKKLPPANNVPLLGMYWDAFYNRNVAKGTVQDFEKAYRRYVEPTA